MIVYRGRSLRAIDVDMMDSTEEYEVRHKEIIRGQLGKSMSDDQKMKWVWL